MNAPPRIGLFGWYMHGNFGDEIMAIMIARTLKFHGFHPVVYKLPRYLADAEGFETVDSVDALTNGASACVLGGGGLLVSAADAITTGNAVLDEELRQLAVLCAARSIPVWGVSIGGTGAGRHAKLYPGLACFLASRTIRGVTLRLEHDRPLMDAFDIPSQHYPDIVFLAPEYWPCPSNQRRDIIVTNKIAGYWAGRRLIHVLDTFGPSVFRIEPRHVRTRNVNSPLQALARPVGRLDRHVPYVTIQRYADLISRTRAVISSKLHLGIFAMAYGTVFFAYGGKEKTQAQLRELGLESHILSTSDLPGWLLRVRRGFSEELEATARAVPELRARARGHVTALLSFLHAETGQGQRPDTGLPAEPAAPSLEYGPTNAAA